MILLKSLLQAPDFRPFHAPEPDKEITGVYLGDLLSWVMGRASAGDAWATIMSNQNVAAVAVLADVACVILVEDVQPDDALLAAAQQRGINLLGTPLSAYALACRLRGMLADGASAPPV